MQHLKPLYLKPDLTRTTSKMEGLLPPEAYRCFHILKNSQQLSNPLWITKKSQIPLPYGKTSDIFKTPVGVIVHHSPHLIPKSSPLQSKMFPISSLLKPFLTNHSLENFCQSENHYSLGTPSCRCPLKHAAPRKFYHIGDGT